MKNTLISILTITLFGCATTYDLNTPIITEEQASKMTIKDLNNAIVYQPQNVNLHLARADYFASTPSVDIAQEEYQIALNMKPNDSKIELKYANFLCNRKYDINSAIPFYNKAFSNSDTKLQPTIYSDYAYCLAATEKYGDALNLYQKALSYDNPPLSAYIGIVGLYTKALNYPMANYYASLYSGTPTAKSLEMQIGAVRNMIDNNSSPEDHANLVAKYNTLNEQYDKLTGKKFADIPAN
ncbi:MAG: hypothetical protein EKK64_10595 [Neisseriaceae bacterium]|nr:MAG: hypothetical protein EKK64_10595 [Neisseriaceae bacterium]